MSPRSLLAEAAQHGVRLRVIGERIEYEAPTEPPADLIERLRAHRHELRALLAEPWIVSSGSDGDMRLVVASPPPWPDDVLQAAALVEVIDRHHRTGADALAHAAALRLEAKLAVLRGQGVEAWWTS